MTGGLGDWSHWCKLNSPRMGASPVFGVGVGPLRCGGASVWGRDGSSGRPGSSGQVGLDWRVYETLGLCYTGPGGGRMPEVSLQLTV